MQFLAFTAILVVVLHCAYSCRITARGVSGAEKKIILQAHNELRAKIANGKERGFPTAANMLELEWDDHLARQAQALADQCEFEHSPAYSSDGEEAGQNIYESGGYGNKAEWKAAVESWYSEVEDFSPRDIRKHIDDDNTGHFTQVIWAKTSKVGCGFTRYTGTEYGFLYFCNYAPAGNYEGESVYEIGRPCSKCGGCGSIRGLCEAN